MESVYREAIRTRYERALLLVATSRIKKIPRKKWQLWKVESESTPGKFYTIVEKDDGPECDCPDFVHRGNTCKHIYAIILYDVA